jgi:CRISPR/Cas system-associated protein Cas10 (large subunit of type III CRISPR-Cas system)
MKRCNVCGELKPLDDFYKSAGMRDGHRNDCKVCNLAAKKARTALDPQTNRDRVKRWQRDNYERYRARQREYRNRPERKAADREYQLLRKYGITIAEYEARLRAQGGGCRICGDPPAEGGSLHVDHDHVTGKVRGLLCFRCNNAIGDLRDDIELVYRMLDYLDRDEEIAQLVRERVEALAG